MSVNGRNFKPVKYGRTFDIPFKARYVRILP